MNLDNIRFTFISNNAAASSSSSFNLFTCSSSFNISFAFVTAEMFNINSDIIANA